MTATSDICWQQLCCNYNKALKQLTAAVELSRQRPLSQLEKQGIIQAFKLTHELAWQVMKDYIFIKAIAISPTQEMLLENPSNKV